MFGLDQFISDLGRGGNPAVVLTVALLLGLRHASDPDHLVAVSTLVASERERRLVRAGRLGLAWGFGHATSLLAVGVPFVLVAALLPRRVESAAELAIGCVIMLLAVRLLRLRRSEAFHARTHRHRVRSPLQAYGIGVLHGVGGSAGVAVLLLAGIGNRTEALAALMLFALATAASMAALSAGFGAALALPRVERRLASAVPALAALAFGFGLFYAVGAA